MSQTTHLIRRSGVWNYRRRVPVSLVQKLGRKIVQFSLNTASLKEAKKRRTVEDLKWDAKLASLEQPSAVMNSNLQISAIGGLSTRTDRETLRLVQDYVARIDERAKRAALDDPPENEAQRLLAASRVKVGIYNHQLCITDRSLWRYAKRSISDWKNEYMPECDGCTVRAQCAGFFSSAKFRYSAHIQALSDVSRALV